VTSLSMAAAALPVVRGALARHTVADCRKLAALAMDAAGPCEARETVRAAVDPAVLDA